MYIYIYGIVTGSSQVLQSTIATDDNISIENIITKPSLTSSRLYSDATCDSDDNTPNENHPLLSDSQVTTNSDDLLKSEVTSDQVSCSNDNCFSYLLYIHRNQQQKSGWKSWV